MISYTSVNARFCIFQKESFTESEASGPPRLIAGKAAPLDHLLATDAELQCPLPNILLKFTSMDVGAKLKRDPNSDNSYSCWG